MQANGIQYSDANFKSELGHWLGQGVMGPTGMQAKMAQLAVVFLDVGPEQTKKDADADQQHALSRLHQHSK